MSFNPRQVVQKSLYDLYSVIPSRINAPSVGVEIAKNTWPMVDRYKLKEAFLTEMDEHGKPILASSLLPGKSVELTELVWVQFCKECCADFLREPPEEDDLQTSFDLFATPSSERELNEKIGNRRYRSPVDGAYVDLVDPLAITSDEMYQLADSIEKHGLECVEKSKYLRQLAKLRKKRGL